MNLLPNEYLTSVCEVKTLQNELLSTGIITRITPDDMDISVKTGVMPLLRFRDEVKLSVFNHKYGFRVLTGLVYLSNRQFLRVFDTQNILDYERRNFFRVDTNFPGSIMLLREGAAYDAPKDVTVSNLSLGGALIISDVELQSDETIQLLFHANEKDFIFTCKIHRVEQRDQKSWTAGCEFFDYSVSQSDALCSYLFQCQRDYLKQLQSI